LTTRREFLKNTSRLAAVTSVAGAAIATQAGREALASDALPNVHPGHSDTISVALVGCGGRGTGAAGNALTTNKGPVKLVALAEDSVKKNLKVGVGLMSRHSRALQELHKRVEDGEIGDIILMRGYRMHGPVGHAFNIKWPGNPSELLWQIREFHSFLWASGG